MASDEHEGGPWLKQLLTGPTLWGFLGLLALTAGIWLFTFAQAAKAMRFRQTHHDHAMTAVDVGQGLVWTQSLYGLMAVLAGVVALVAGTTRTLRGRSAAPALALAAAGFLAGALLLGIEGWGVPIALALVVVIPALTSALGKDREP